MNEHQQLVVRALEQMRGDDLARAKGKFRYCTPEQMQQQYGASGMTRMQIIEEYQKRDAEISAAIAWVSRART